MPKGAQHHVARPFPGADRARTGPWPSAPKARQFTPIAGAKPHRDVGKCARNAESE